MNALQIVRAYILARPLTSLLNLLLLALGVATMSFVLNASQQVEQLLTRDAAGIDLVVGAKGSPLQLILSGIYHLDAPTGNIPLAEAEQLAHHPLVKQAIPLSLGDSFHGFRIVGTNAAYMAHYQARYAAGGGWLGPMQVVLGATVAQRSGLTVGGRFVGSHGLAEGGPEHAHEDDFYTVTGVLQPTGTVLDRLVLTPTESVWQVHEDEEADEHASTHAAKQPHEREITLLLVQYASPLAAASLPRQVNASSQMQAASPAYESARLFSLLGVGANVLQVFSMILVLSAALSMFIGLSNALQERRYDLAILRALGATPAYLARLMLLEGLLLSLLGALLGLLLGHGLLGLVAHWTSSAQGMPLHPAMLVVAEGWLLAGALAVGLLATLWPAWRAARTDIHQVLAQG